MILHIASREIRSLFLSPLAWSILAVLQFILAWMFIINIEQFLLIQPRLAGIEGAPGVTDIVVTPLLGLVGILLLIVMPLITMRLVSEERRNQTLQLLLSAPISSIEIILGKFTGIMAFIGIMLTLILLMTLSLSIGTRLDFGQIFSGLIGLTLMLATFTAIGLYISCLTSQPTVAAVVTFGVLFILWIINWANQITSQNSEVLSWLSMTQHQQNFLRGIIDSSDLLYYLLLISLFLILSIRKLDAERLQH